MNHTNGNQKRNLYVVEVEGEKKEIKIDKAYCVGYAGRNKEKTWEHVKELAEIGVPEPEEVPSLYPVSISSLSQGKRVEVIGDKTSGEAEIVLIYGDSSDEVFVTVGSDHTDRSLETIDINKSKQVCDKPFATKAWSFEKVKDHWDQLELSSQIYIDGEWIAYQKDTIDAIIPYEEIKEYLNRKNVPLRNSIAFSGTVPLLDGFKYGEKFRMVFSDPTNGDQIKAEYEIDNLID
ncbi:DUF2848 family protein [Pseudalkalibacillus salsuginis]|uniref:DUF2848 family protein n=1 Tax=Pseudalkalibacillus salsuginis TaxID=2910972 RepID=UPI001F4728C1|nr:DUF2848 family protein [Pseudalkalibacillus salsuginis]MCF6411357.1 DUF2848 domain-containing protein [Pseudalkalibacillus salsuginis]